MFEIMIGNAVASKLGFQTAQSLTQRYWENYPRLGYYEPAAPGVPIRVEQL